VEAATAAADAERVRLVPALAEAARTLGLQHETTAVRITDLYGESAGIPTRGGGISSPFRLCLVAAAPPPRKWRWRRDRNLAVRGGGFIVVERDCPRLGGHGPLNVGPLRNLMGLHAYSPQGAVREAPTGPSMWQTLFIAMIPHDSLTYHLPCLV
jgi:hypothetical protein